MREGMGAAKVSDTSKNATGARAAFGDLAPKLAELTDDFLIGEIWERPGLSQRDRSLITISVLTALSHGDALLAHLHRALDNGVTRDEILEMILHVTFYGGWPTGMSATGIARKVFEVRGLL
jgi:4-carboxymuconolactone decarboxylase